MKQIALFIALILLVIFIVLGFRIYGQNKEISKIEKAVITETTTETVAKTGDITTLTKTPTGLTSSGEIDINTEDSYIRFTGFGPGKSHTGSFESMNAELIFEDGFIIGGKMVIEASSVKTDSEGLDSHLKSDDFFGVENNPQIIFNLNEVVVNDMNQTAMANGELNLNGITNNISVPLKILSNGFFADFTIDISLFDISYIGVNNEVQIETQILWN